MKLCFAANCGSVSDLRYKGIVVGASLDRMAFHHGVAYIVSREPDVAVGIFDRLAGDSEFDFCVLSAVTFFGSPTKYPVPDVVLGCGLKRFGSIDHGDVSDGAGGGDGRAEFDGTLHVRREG